MGTRHLICVVSDGEYKLAQYGQWDGYPSGQGEAIVDFLLETTPDDWKTMKTHLAASRMMDEDEAKAMGEDWGKVWIKKHPQMSRDSGAKTLKYILETPEPYLAIDRLEFAGDSLFCEWAYVIDLDRSRLEVYKGFNQEPVPSNERFYSLPIEKPAYDGTQYHQVKHLKTYLFDELTSETMGGLESELEDEDE